MADYKKLEQEESREGVAMRVHRFIDKRLVTRGIPSADGTSMQYIAEATEIYQLEIELSGGKVLIEPGALQYLHGKITAEVIRHEDKGFFSRAIASAGTGESAYATAYSGAGKIWCEPGRRHFVLATMDGEQDSLLLDDKAFYACSGGISLSSHRHTNVSGVLSGSGFMQPKLTGRGVFAVESPVPVSELEVIEVGAGEEVVVDGDYMLMYSAALTVSIGPLVRGLRNALRSGEGLVYRFSGQGQIYVMPTARIG